ncbi:MAG: hypothetical protein U0X91_05180 [Spirosomataceae bacterium]
MKKQFAIGILSLLTTMTAAAHPGIGIVCDSKGNIFYTDLKQVWKIAADGKRSLAVPHVHTHELFMDAQDNLFGEHLWYEGEKTDKWGTYAWQYTANGQIINLTGNVEGFQHGHPLCRDAAGNMYWADRDKVEKYIFRKTPKGDIEVLYSGKFTDIRWQFCQKDGTFYFIDDNDLYKLTPRRKLVLVAKDVDDVPITPPHTLSNGNNHSIYGIWDDPQGNMYVAVMSKNQIRKITKEGTVSIVYESPLGLSPTGGVFDQQGDLWVLETRADNTVRVTEIPQKKIGDKAVTGTSWTDLLFDEVYMAFFLFLSAFILYGFGKRRSFFEKPKSI